MKKWLLAGSISIFCLLLVGGVFYSKITADREAPEIAFTGQLTYSEGMTTEELLSDVSAEDLEDGDVSDSLVVESYSINEEEKTAVIIYAARDSKNNIARISRRIPLSENKENTNTKKEKEKDQSRNSDTDSMLSQKTEGQTEAGKESESEFVSERETATESLSERRTTAESEETEETEEQIPGAPVITLTEKKLTIQKGESFDPLLYIASIVDDIDNKYELWRDIQIDGEYDVNSAGSYQLVFYVTDSDGNMSNRARFRLIVEDK